jgi:hypothetical protein
VISASIAFWSACGIFVVLRPIWLRRRERQIKGALEAQRAIAGGSSIPEGRKRLAWMSS